MSEIIVGVDGSLASEQALRWAAHEAGRRDVALVVQHTYDWRVYGALTPINPSFAVGFQKVAEAIVDSAVEQARSWAPGVAVRGTALLGSAAHTLVEASGSGDLVVVGNRGRGGFASLLLGSVSQQVAAHAAGPVVVVRGRADDSAGPIVVGVDDSDAADFALGAAFEEASIRGAGVLAVHVYTPFKWVYGPEFPPDVEDEEEQREAERDRVAVGVARWKQKFPAVDVAPVAVDGHPAEMLADMSGTAQLVIVGTRGHGGFAGLLLGSVGMQLLHHADCPVLIARPFIGEDTLRP